MCTREGAPLKTKFIQLSHVQFYFGSSKEVKLVVRRRCGCTLIALLTTKPVAGFESGIYRKGKLWEQAGSLCNVHTLEYQGREAKKHEKTYSNHGYSIFFNPNQITIQIVRSPCQTTELSQHTVHHTRLLEPHSRDKSTSSIYDWKKSIIRES